MIQDQSCPVLPRRSQRSRQKVVRTGAQYARYFLLGLALVSLFVGLNVSLAGRTAEFAVSIHALEKQCRVLEWENAETVSRIALKTNIEEVQRFAQERGFTMAETLVYVKPASTIDPGRSPTTLEGSASISPSAALQVPAELSIWSAALQELQHLMSSLQR